MWSKIDGAAGQQLNLDIAMDAQIRRPGMRGHFLVSLSFPLAVLVGFQDI